MGLNIVYGSINGRNGPFILIVNFTTMIIVINRIVASIIKVDMLVFR
jgi:hypothetical protein